MGAGIASWCFFVLVLLVFLSGIRARELTDKVILQLPSMGQKKTESHFLQHPPKGNQLNPKAIVFFTPQDLKLGAKLPFYFPNINSSPNAPFLSREEADSIPFSLKELPFLLDFFSFTPDSPQAKAMESTIRNCKVEPLPGESKYCPTSLESMLDFVRSIFGPESELQGLNTIYLKKSDTDLQNYTVLSEPEQIRASRIVACHSFPYPYAVFHCHSQESDNRVYRVSLGGEHGDRVEAVVVCHMDTSQWDRDHISFQVLGIEPGSSPVCHVFPACDLVWVPKPATLY